MPTAKITKTTCDSATPDPDRSYIIWDRDLTGFGLLVLPSGVRSFIYQYRNAERRSRRATLGKFGPITADQARRMAKAHQRIVSEGGDPVEVKQTAKAAIAIGDILDAYLDSEQFKGKAESTQQIDRGRIERHLRPLLGRMKAEALTVEAVKRVHSQIRDGKTATTERTGPRGVAKVRGGPGTAKKAIRLLSAILSWAKAEGMVQENPAGGIKVAADRSRNVILEDGAAYGRLFSTLDRMEAEARIRQPVADCIRLIALTGCRKSEATGMRWRNVDLKAGLITLTEHKTAASTGADRVIGLPAAAAALIARQPNTGPDGYVFSLTGGEKPVSLQKAWERVHREAELPPGLGLHALRHSHASHMAMQGAEATEIMVALGHRDISTSAKYVHAARDYRQQIAERAASVALAGMAAASGAKTAAVVPLGKGRKP